MDRLIISPLDNVAVVITATDTIPAGHKVAIKNIAKGEKIIKYGFPIGIAKVDIAEGDWVHSHNLKSALGDNLDYLYQPKLKAELSPRKATFMGYRRVSGVGTRNDLWIIPTVGCVNNVARALEKACQGRYPGVDAVTAVTHPYGCSQMGDDQLNTQRILSGLVKNNNAGGVLVLGLGCENNNIEVFKEFLGNYDKNRIKFLSLQDAKDDMGDAIALLDELYEVASKDVREECSASELVIGLKCGGSDGYSGITANSLVGRLSDIVISCGGSTVLTEVPEMFGSETILMERCVDKRCFDKAVKLINDFKDYFRAYGQTVCENPSPGNKAGGITTLEEKSLGCTNKSGNSAVMDVLTYGERLTAKGLNLLQGPGNDIVSLTALTASGANLLMFTTGRGTPLGGIVPTVKIASNTAIADKKSSWIDFDAGVMLEKNAEETAEKLFYSTLAFASGTKTKNEINGYKEIAIFKNGVTL